mmetsp:Transcript_87640/g.246180  ORF Transcript_87640/g.246180 Transcript_87640/m.246180 type:complete len:205 (+) Transcript_87640:709-1323(+)
MRSVLLVCPAPLLPSVVLLEPRQPTRRDELCVSQQAVGEAAGADDAPAARRTFACPRSTRWRISPSSASKRQQMVANCAIQPSCSFIASCNSRTSARMANASWTHKSWFLIPSWISLISSRMSASSESMGETSDTAKLCSWSLPRFWSPSPKSAEKDNHAAVSANVAPLSPVRCRKDGIWARGGSGSQPARDATAISQKKTQMA